MKLTKIITGSILLALSAMSLIGCHSHKEANDVVKVGIIDGPDTVLWEAAQKNALQKYGLHIELVKFSDYVLPNEALNSGDIDANAFQHVPFLDEQIKSRGYKLIPIAKTFVYPIAMYSQKIKSIKQLKTGDTIAIPNDPSNEARALLLLQQGHLVTLRKNADINATPADIASNPKKLVIKEIDAAQLPRVLPDVTAAIINNDYAGPAGLTPKTALLIENANSPYINVIVIRPNEKGKKKITEMIAAFQTPEVKALSKKISHGNAIAGW
jgi:D-methionine transport system substrate-binding protein